MQTQLVQSELENRGIKVSLDDFQELDSSNDTKASRHVLLGKDKVIFENIHGAQREFMDKLRQQLDEENKRYTHVFVDKETPNGKVKVPALDFGIYSSNRFFRVAYSTKFGAHRPFVPAGCPRSQVPAAPSDMERWLVVASTKEIADAKANKVFVEASAESEPMSTGTSADDRNLHTLADFVFRDLLGDKNAEYTGYRIMPGRRHLLLSVDSRKCPLTLRNHKSNSPYGVIDIKDGTFSVRCHDPDCKAKHNRNVKLPTPHTTTFKRLERPDESLHYHYVHNRNTWPVLDLHKLDAKFVESVKNVLDAAQ